MDAFFDDSIPLSGTAAPVQEFTGDFLSTAQSVLGILTRARWTSYLGGAEDRYSYAIQGRSQLNLPFSAAYNPEELHEISSGTFHFRDVVADGYSSRHYAFVTAPDGLIYRVILYDSRRERAPDSTLTDVWQQEGDDEVGSAEAFATGLSTIGGGLGFSVVFYAVVPNPDPLANPPDYQLKFTADNPGATAADKALINYGAGPAQMSGGFLWLESPAALWPPGATSSGDHRLRLQLGDSTTLSPFQPNGFGTLIANIEVLPSGGGSFRAAFRGGTYRMHAGPYDLIIQGPKDSGEGMLAALLAIDLHNEAAAFPVVCAGENYGAYPDVNADFNAVRDQLHWEYAIATGYHTSITHTAVGSRLPNPGDARTPGVLFRGSRVAPLFDFLGKPLAGPAYVALASDPDSALARVGGKLYDAIVAPDGGVGAILYGGKRFESFLTTDRAGDLVGTLYLVAPDEPPV